MLDEECEESWRERPVDAGSFESDPVAEAHLCDGCGDAGFADVMEGEDVSVLVEGVEGFCDFPDHFEIGKAVFEEWGFDHGNRRAGFLELR